MKRIIILGGMGPQASLRLHELLIERCGAKKNNEYPFIIHLSIPVKDFIESPDAYNEALEIILTQLQQLNLGAEDRVVIACNTAHIMFESLQSAFASTYFFHMPEETEKYLQNKMKYVLLGTPTTKQSDLYERCERSKNRSEEPLIHAVLEGQPPRMLAMRLDDILDHITEGGEKGVVIGCSELSAVYAHCVQRSTVLDPISIAANALIEDNL